MTVVSKLTAPDSTIVAPPLGTETVRNNEFLLGRAAREAPDNRAREWWEDRAERDGSDWDSILDFHLWGLWHLGLLETDFIRRCCEHDERRKPAAPRKPTSRPTPQTTIEAVMWTVRQRGPVALREPTNIERLRTFDSAAKAQINKRIARIMGETNG